MEKVRDYDITTEFLEEYEQAAIKNAEELLNDAKILFKQKSFARAYFLSVASIEETGKAYTAFHSRGRNLSDPGLKERLRKLFENHSHKITSAFICWILTSLESKDVIMNIVNLMTDLKQHREVSMYVDVYLNGIIFMPSQVIWDGQAFNSVRIAENCLCHTKEYINNNSPVATSSFDDKMFSIGISKIQKVYKERDFWEFLLTELKKDASVSTYPRAIVTFYENNLSRKK